MLLASNGENPEKLPSVQDGPPKNYLVQNVHGAELEEPWLSSSIK